REGCRGRHEVQLAGTEVAVFQADVQAAAKTIVDARDALVSPSAVADAERFHAGPADTRADVEIHASRITEAEKPVDHARPNIDVVSKVEAVQVPVREHERRRRRGAGRIEERRDAGAKSRVLAE